MYYNYNDNELIYLIKDNNQFAKKVLYDKYSHLIRKIYNERNLKNHFLYYDFQQECYLALEKAIYSFNTEKGSSFYSFYSVVVSYLITKLLRNDRLKLKETNTVYEEIEREDHYHKNDLKRILEYEFKDSDEVTKLLISEFLGQNYKLIDFVQKYNLEYYSTYRLLKKIRLKVENILTK